MTETKVAFITGGNRGLGFETARELGEKGIKVVIGSRDSAKGAEALKKLQGLGIEAETLTFDINKSGDHAKVSDYFSKKFGKLDILVNNAGVFLEGAADDAKNRTKSTSQEALRNTFDSNFFNVVALTQTLLPLIEKSPAGRIVNLSSILGSLTLHADPKSPIADMKAFAYNTSKAALNSFTIHLAHALKGTKVKVNSAHPGWVKTEMGGSAAPMEVKDGGKTSAQLALLPDSGPTGGFFHLGEALPW